MAKLEIALSLEQIIDGICQLNDEEKRRLASLVLSERRLEAFVEELEDHLSCERVLDEGPPERFSPDELTPDDL